MCRGHRHPYHVAGAMQDSARAGAKRHAAGGIHLPTGTTSAAAKPSRLFRPKRSEHVSAVNIRLIRATTIAQGVTQRHAWPENPWQGGRRHEVSLPWTAPIAGSPSDPKVVTGAQVIFRTTDGGQSWTAISPDLSAMTVEAEVDGARSPHNPASKPTARLRDRRIAEQKADLGRQ